ncbi:uncharacterized protein BO72DRAFT_444106 [Aspergillus fijiensis CBS 313.89]|uniref:Uncharacterized protein n=1 Tax=Aspergillus fijiensis CBS 313.89 TaxID=1448319 RepID=A0A8G1S2C3_9EURO|nr:uncharacterized protein BO72DRAFT_444106 [Aspergillus fijiensis CBS 313.89]RAK82136.1 hypothetical protein BO72DRAFT_444106 [Aspergillus fijiensis CBS 313.89]
MTVTTSVSPMPSYHPSSSKETNLLSKPAPSGRCLRHVTIVTRAEVGWNAAFLALLAGVFPGHLSAWMRIVKCGTM